MAWWLVQEGQIKPTDLLDMDLAFLDKTYRARVSWREAERRAYEAARNKDG